MSEGLTPEQRVGASIALTRLADHFRTLAGQTREWHPVGGPPIYNAMDAWEMAEDMTRRTQMEVWPEPDIDETGTVQP